MQSLPVRAALFVLPAASLLVGGCAGGSSSTGAATQPRPETPLTEWESLRHERPSAAPGAARIALGDVLILGSVEWSLPPTVNTQAAVAELMAAQLLERTDVEFVERRRFGAAAERDRRGEMAPRGQPPLGTSRAAEYLLLGTWSVSGSGGLADFRLADAETGEVVHAWRTETPARPDAASLSRALSGALLTALTEMGRRPAGSGPVDLPSAFAPSGVAAQAQGAFFRGVSAEDRFDWEAAKDAYEAAADLAGPTFPEAGVALARVARLRLGGTLAAS